MKTTKPEFPVARIIQDTRDARRDRFLPLDEAKWLFEQGKLEKLEMGPRYPNSYRWKGSAND